ncbi:AAEL008080-PA [Aedes aegypti]|uniref:AAEL008080-PA n=1 Tax=Aedes aegypti TaxID=7159 RepID=Q16ZR0_AEDAE|nr:AAEL008080-PA [Aedes aegypti]
MISLAVISLASLLYSVDSSLLTVPQNPKISGGVNASLEDFPYMVSIRLKALESSTGFGDGFFCQGVLTSPRSVLTSSDCVLNGSGPRTPEELSLVLGTVSRTNASGAIAVDPEQIWINYDGRLAVIKLAQEVLCVRPVVLNEFQQDGGKQCILMGWGANSTDGKPVETLQEVYVRITKEKCPQNLICARADKENAGICLWDTGVPLLCDGSLSGVYVGKPNHCGIEIEQFASVRAHWDWIGAQIAAANGTNHRSAIWCLLILGLLISVKNVFLSK